MNTRTLKKVNKYVYFIFLGFFILFITYLSIPLLYKIEKIRPELEKQLFDNFDLNVKLNKKIQYLFLPSPRFKINNNKFINLSSKDKIMSNKNEVSIKIDLFNLLNKNNLKINSVIIDNSIFNIEFSDFKYFKDSFFKKIKNRKIYLNSSKFLIKNESKIITMIDIEKSNLKFEKNSNKLIFNSNIFTTNFNGILSNKFNKDQIFTKQLFFPDIGLSLKSISNSNKGQFKNTHGTTTIKVPKAKFKFKHFLSSEKFIISESKIESNHIRGSADAQIIFDPFYFSITSNLSKFNFIDFFSSNIFKKNDYLNFFNLDSKINGNLNIIINNFNSKLIQSGNISVEFKNDDIIINNINFQIENNDYFHLDGLFFKKKNKNFLKFNSSINIADTKKIFSHIPVSRNKKVKKLNLYSSGNYEFGINKLKLDMIASKGKNLSNNLTIQINEDLNTFFKGKSFLDLFNMIKFRKFIYKMTNLDN